MSRPTTPRRFVSSTDGFGPSPASPHREVPWNRTPTAAFGRSVIPISSARTLPGERRRSPLPGIMIAGTLLIAGVVSVGAFAVVGGTLLPNRTGSANSEAGEQLPADPNGSPSVILTGSASDLPSIEVEALPEARGTGKWAVVQQVAAYQAKFPKLASCPTPKRMKSWAGYKKYTSKQLACVQRAWAPTLKAHGLRSTKLPHSYYRGASSTSGCGMATAPAFYCSADGGRIYFGANGYKAGTWWKLSTGTTVMHEYGHHLQSLFGILAVRSSLTPKDETTRRVELQATCFAWGMLRRQSSYKLNKKTGTPSWWRSPSPPSKTASTGRNQ